MMMKENGVQFQISSSITAAKAKSGLLSQAGLNSMPRSRLMRSFTGPLWYSIISPV